MNKEIDEIKIRECLEKRKARIKIYIELINELHETDVSKNIEYIKKYKNFYRMNMARGLSDEFYNDYFIFLQNNKNNKDNLTFEKVLKYLYYESKKSKRIEASFSSKLLATINPNMPVWDTNVFSWLKEYNIKKPKITKDKDLQLNLTINTYKLLEKILNNIIKNEGQKYIQVFNDTFVNNPDLLNISDMKKIDLILWSLGDKNKKGKIYE